jgi:hypothetical protein
MLVGKLYMRPKKQTHKAILKKRSRAFTPDSAVTTRGAELPHLSLFKPI